MKAPLSTLNLTDDQIQRLMEFSEENGYMSFDDYDVESDIEVIVEDATIEEIKSRRATWSDPGKLYLDDMGDDFLCIRKCQAVAGQRRSDFFAFEFQPGRVLIFN